MDLKKEIANALASGSMSIDDFTVSKPEYGKVVVQSANGDSRKLRDAYQVVCHLLPKDYDVVYSESSFTVRRRLRSV